MKHWKLGVILGVLYGVVTFYFGYAMLHGVMGIWKGTLFFYFLVIPICVFGVYYARKKGGGFISFTDSFLLCLTIIIVGVFLSQVINGVYISRITEVEQDRMMDIIVENQLETLEYMEVDELEFEDSLRAQMKGMFEINAVTIATSVFSIFLLSIFGVIISLIMRKDKPIE